MKITEGFFYIIILLLLCIVNCNFQQQCFNQNGNGSLDTCATGLSLYNSLPEERRSNSLERTLFLCLYEYKKIDECKNEPRRWPLPD